MGAKKRCKTGKYQEKLDERTVYMHHPQGISTGLTLGKHKRDRHDVFKIVHAGVIASYLRRDGRLGRGHEISKSHHLYTSATAVATAWDGQPTARIVGNTIIYNDAYP